MRHVARAEWNCTHRQNNVRNAAAAILTQVYVAWDLHCALAACWAGLQLAAIMLIQFGSSIQLGQLCSTLVKNVKHNRTTNDTLRFEF